MRKSFLLTTALALVLFAPVVSAQPAGPGSARHDAPGLDGVFLRLADELPGFGGYFFDENGDLNVYLTEVSREPAARARLNDVAQNRPQRWRQPWLRAAAIIVRKADYDFSQLDTIRLRLAAGMGALDGVNLFDTNEQTNRVLVGVRDEEARQRVLGRITALNLPHEAFTIEVMENVSFATSLRNSVRPVVGGLLAQFTKADNITYDCSLGATVLYGNATAGIPTGTPGFYIASHCSQTQGVTDGMVFTQGGARIGVEQYDAPMFSWRTSPDCPYQSDAYVCRYSDVLFAAYDAGVNKKQGYLAKTLYAGVGLNNPGSIDLNMLGAWQFATTSTVPPVAGMTLDKVGQRTGWTEGTVRNTCADQPVFSYDLNKWVYILCTTEVDAYAFDGDSGAPVFQILGTNNTAAFAGIVWAKTARGSFYFSSVAQIAKDMGSDVRYVP